MSKKSEMLKTVQTVFSRYRSYKASLEQKIIDNQKWYECRHWDVQKAKKDENMLNPVSNFIFSAIANKHADAIDYYPEPNIRPNDAKDIEEAEKLTKIIPRILEANGFDNTYSSVMWDKLINGVGIYGIFFNPSLKQGIGDIDIRGIDFLNIYWESGVEDIQDSPYLFITQWFDKTILADTYPSLKSELSALSGNDAAKPLAYDGVNAEVYNDKVLVVDCYYKKIVDGRCTVQLFKYADEVVLDWTEESNLQKNGLYDHGLYPVVLDPLFPIKGSPAGMGIPDIAKNQQEYINKLDQCISRNSILAAKPKTLVSDAAKVNDKEMTDYEQEIVHAQGAINEEKVRQLQYPAIPNVVYNQRLQKINELKEVAGNRDFSQGGTSNGVTAMGAISLLQEAGEKLSRDSNFMTYANYKKIIYMVIELIRQFYSDKRTFRIDDTTNEFAEYSNENLVERPPVYDDFGNMISEYHRPEFDVTVTAQKGNPYNQIKQNSVILQLWSAGFFNEQLIDSSVIALSQMHFDGKEEIISALQDLKAQRQSEMQMGQQPMQGAPSGAQGGGLDQAALQQQIETGEADGESRGIY